VEHLTRKLAFIIGTLLLLGSVPATAAQYVFGRADFPAGNAPSSVAKADFNGDGAVDLAVTNATDNTVSIFLGKQNSTFAPNVAYPTGETPVSVIVADFNGDGKLDLAIANVNGNSISVLLGNGDGTFQPHVDYATDFGPVFLATADLNNDHKMDLVASTESLAVSVLLGHGDGTFRPCVSYQDAGGAGSGPAGTVHARGLRWKRNAGYCCGGTFGQCGFHFARQGKRHLSNLRGICDARGAVGGCGRGFQSGWQCGSCG